MGVGRRVPMGVGDHWGSDGAELDCNNNKQPSVFSFIYFLKGLDIFKLWLN